MWPAARGGLHSDLRVEQATTNKVLYESNLTLLFFAISDTISYTIFFHDLFHSATKLALLSTQATLLKLQILLTTLSRQQDLAS